MVPAGAGPGNCAPTTTGRPLEPGIPHRLSTATGRDTVIRRQRVGASLVGARGGRARVDTVDVNHPQPPGRTPSFVLPDLIRYPRWGAGCGWAPWATARLDVRTYPPTAPLGPRSESGKTGGRRRPFDYDPAQRNHVPPRPTTGARKRRPYTVPAGAGPGNTHTYPPVSPPWVPGFPGTTRCVANRGGVPGPTRAAILRPRAWLP